MLVPVNVCPAVPETVARSGRAIEFVDLRSAELPDVDVKAAVEILRARPSRFGGVIWVRPYGSLHDATAEFALLRAALPEGLLLDDRCLCAPDPSLPDLGIGTDAYFYSTGPAKVVSIGGGGFGRARADRTDEPSPVSEAADAYLGAIRRELERVEPVRERNRALYDSGLEPWRLPDRYQNWRYHLLLENADEVRALLWERGIPSSRHYRPAAPHPDAFPRAFEFQRRVLNLFLGPEIDPDMARQAVDVIGTHGRG